MAAPRSVPRPFEIIAANLPAWPDPSVPIAASRADAIGVLNLEETDDLSIARSALARLDRYGGARRGVKLRATQAALELIAELPHRIDLVILTDVDSVLFREAVDRAAQPGRRVLAEVTHNDAARAAVRHGVTGVLVKGHEAGGFVGEETTFILVQRLLNDPAISVPVWAYGGIGLHSGAACYAAGCAGVLLDAQLSLAQESRLPGRLAATLRRMEGDETICLGNDLRDRVRMYRRPGMEGVEALRRVEPSLAADSSADPRPRWREAVRQRLGWDQPDSQVWLLGQDAASAASLANRFHTVAGIIAAMHSACAEHVAAAAAQKALDRRAPLALAHGTEYPILQGPMTRVSDTPEFAEAVAANGALPFLALALLRGPQVTTLLEQTRERLGDRPWGVGILGFVPLELRREQLNVIEQVRPPFAIIAGGRPDQASRLEALGIATYLHVPAPGLLKMFLEDGARRFIFEGRECGGHVGPRTSFVLWETMIDALLEAIDGGVSADALHIVFAGGIHDALSAAMVATMAAPLVARGARIGVLLGTAYLFTEEAVQGRAIVEHFQREAVDCSNTVLLETGPGHSTRCVETPFYDTFRHTKLQLIAAGKGAEDIRSELEHLNLGRLRVASKGIVRESDGDHGAVRYTAVGVERQRQDGMYMIGQVAALRRTSCRMNDLHTNVCTDSVALLTSFSRTTHPDNPIAGDARPCDIAIVGMGCLLPRAQDVETFWRNLLGKVDAIEEVPKERFDVDLYFDPDRKARDKIYSRWGGFLEDVPFDPLRYGIPPASLASIDPFQLLALEVVHQALAHAGYLDRPYPKAHTSVILGASGGLGDLGAYYGVRAALPLISPTPSPKIFEALPEWTEDSFAGLLLNVAAGRVANRFDFGGVNFTVDAACASSLAAIALATRELEAGTSDMVIAGGVDTVQNPFGYLCFSKSQALSPRGRCSTFDEHSDGIVISEGLAVVVLKRLADAERDGDRVYAVIKSVAGSSDGRAKGLTAPRPEGQMVALRRAYARAGVPPATVGLIEAHGTGTVAGDAAEVSALSTVFGAAGASGAGCALGSVKSMIGHTKATAGVAGLIKVALALHHKVLPPTLHVQKPNPKLREAGNPFFVNTESLPWVAPSDGSPRRAGVSSFGFGGTNFHAVVEEHPTEVGIPPQRSGAQVWPAELFVWTATSPTALADVLRPLEVALTRDLAAPLREIAAAVARRGAGGLKDQASARLAIVASTFDDLRGKIGVALEALGTADATLADSRGIYLRTGTPAGKLAFVFPGQGSQYPHMLRDLAIYFPEIRERVELADQLLAPRMPVPLSKFIFGPHVFDKTEADARMQAITDTSIAQPALGAVEAGVVDLLRHLGVNPDMCAGHSYGEYVALYAAGVLSAPALISLSHERGAVIKDACGERAGLMCAVDSSADDVQRAIGELPDVWVANLNAPRQTIIAGTEPGISDAERLLAGRSLTTRRIPVACAFHSPLMDAPATRFAAALAGASFAPPRVPVFSNSRVEQYPNEQDAIAEVLRQHMTRPVRFVEQILAMYESGARIFVEVGPRSVLSGLIRQILGDRPVLILCVDSMEHHGVTQLLHVLGQLSVHGVALDPAWLFARRSLEARDYQTVIDAIRPTPAWLVNGGQARPRTAARQARLDPRATAAAATPAQAGAVPVITPVAAGTAQVLPQARAVPPPARAPRTTNSSLEPLEAPVKQPDGDFRRDPAITSIAMAGEDGVMMQFQNLMSQFLRTQSTVMMAYLQRSGARNGDTQKVITQMMLQPAPMDLEAPAAVAKPAPQVRLSTPVKTEAPAAAQARAPQAPRTAAAAPAARMTITPIITTSVPAVAVVEASATVQAPAATTKRDLQAELLQIVSDRTGYPKDMLDLDLNIEADLGIDSIKRVEILSAFQRQCSDAQRTKLQEAMETITAVKTLRATAEALDNLLGDSSNGQQSAASL